MPRTIRIYSENNDFQYVDAERVDGLILTGRGVDLYDPETIRATTGSFFAVPRVRVPAPRDLLPWLEGVKQQVDRVQVVGSNEQATIRVDAHDFTRPTILVIGNETWGMSAFFDEFCDAVVRIPMAGSATSLNVACATSIILYEMDRQRRAGDVCDAGPADVPSRR
jgi:tRNA G18 (ribose-2'-O)-methylase SpoU